MTFVGQMPVWRHPLPPEELVFVEVYAFESYHGKAFCRLFEVFADCEVAVFDELLFHQAVLFEELVQTSLGDVLNHLLWEVCSLGLGGFFDDGAHFVGIFLSEPAFREV